MKTIWLITYNVDVGWPADRNIDEQKACLSQEEANAFVEYVKFREGEALNSIKTEEIEVVSVSV